MMGSLIDEYLEIMGKYTDAPLVFQQAVAYHLISATLGQFFDIPFSKTPRPNLWFILSSIPGRTRRSSLITQFSESPLFLAYVNFYMNIENLSYDDAKNRYSLSQMTEGTPEGICDVIQEGVTQGIVTYNFSDTEFGNTIKNISGKGHYSQGLGTLLSKLYYGERHKQSLSKRGGKESRNVPSGLYITMLSAMQEPKHYLDQNMSRQGLLRRMLIVYVKSKDMSMDNWKPPLGKTDKYSLKEDVKKFVEERLLPQMLKYHELMDRLQKSTSDCEKKLPVMFKDTVEKAINEIAKKADSDIIEDESDVNIYKQNKWEALTKMTAISAIANDSIIVPPKEKQGDTIMTVSDKDFQISKDILESMVIHTDEMMDDLATSTIRATDDKNLDRIYKMVKRAGPNGISKRDLGNNIKMKKRNRDEYIDTLVSDERIVVRQTNLGRPGPQGIKYVADCYAE